MKCHGQCLAFKCNNITVTFAIYCDLHRPGSLFCHIPNCQNTTAKHEGLCIYHARVLFSQLYKDAFVTSLDIRYFIELQNVVIENIKTSTLNT